MSSAVLRELARRYARTQAGRSGSGERDFLLDFEELLRATACERGEARQVAERDLRAAAAAGLVALESHRRDPQLILRVRFAARNEEAFFKYVGEESPPQRRARDAEPFIQAETITVPAPMTGSWKRMCRRFKDAALNGTAFQPFVRGQSEHSTELLRTLAHLLAWEGESLIRFVSCVVCRDSKRLAILKPKLEQLLPLASGGMLNRLSDLGISENPRYALVHGPLRMRFKDGCVHLGLLQGVTRLAGADIQRADAVETDAPRCLTVENETCLLELAKLRDKTLLIGTNGYVGAATLALLERLPSHLEFWHFGDSDPAGFDILRDLRQRSGKPFRGLGMQFRPDSASAGLSIEEKALVDRLISSSGLNLDEKAELSSMLTAGNKGRFEQESLGRPTLSEWPFFPSIHVA